VNEARAYPSEAPLANVIKIYCPKFTILVLRWALVRLGWKRLPRTNTLVLYKFSNLQTKKFTTLGPGDSLG
jgi:hypothetical protein